MDNQDGATSKQTFKSGATSSEKVPSYNLLPINFLDRVASRGDLGAVKHGKFNYRKGLHDKDFILDRLNHAIKHIRIAQDLIESDLGFEDDDLGGAAFNIMMAMEYQVANDITQEKPETLDVARTNVYDKPNCPIPPKGWYCTRGAGHLGPCAAIPER